jgi:hypothetical protein
VSSEDKIQDCKDNDIFETEGDISADSTNSEFEIEPNFKEEEEEEEEDTVDPFADFEGELEKIRQQRKSPVIQLYRR